MTIILRFYRCVYKFYIIFATAMEQQRVIFSENLRQTLEQEGLNKNPASTGFHLCYLDKVANISL